MKELEHKQSLRGSACTDCFDTCQSSAQLYMWRALPHQLRRRFLASCRSGSLSGCVALISAEQAEQDPGAPADPVIIKFTLTSGIF